MNVTRFLLKKKRVSGVSSRKTWIDLKTKDRISYSHLIRALHIADLRGQQETDEYVDIRLDQNLSWFSEQSLDLGNNWVDKRWPDTVGV